ncbi:hypothetical protein ACQVP2_10840 [Methylobacterium aquaticum]
MIQIKQVPRDISERQIRQIKRARAPNGLLRNPHLRLGKRLVRRHPS